MKLGIGNYKLTLIKHRNPCGSPDNTSKPTGLPNAFNFFANIIQSSKHGSASTDWTHMEKRERERDEIMISQFL